MGEVYLAQDTELEREVALKVMSVELARDLNQRKRFRTEARAASGLVHPNICVIHEVGETEDGRPFLAMEYVDGQTLTEILLQRRLRLREVVKVGLQAAEALEAAHARGIVHRDIKPGNLMADQRGNVKVLDFGLAKRFGQDELAATTTSLAHTKTGMLVGTPYYMSPEQVLGRELDPRSDIFSLGVVLYELAVGQKPFLGKTVGETLNNVVNQPPEPLGLDNPLFSPALDQVILKCLEKDPAKRYQSAKDLAADLRPIYEKTLPATEPPKPVNPAAAAEPPKPLPARTASSSWRLPAFAGVLMAGVIGVILLVQPGRFGGGPSRKAAAAQKSVAVLPFDNISGESNTEYLSQGLTEEVTAALSRVPGLKVAARNSASLFNRKQDVQKIGAALRVGTLLEGSVRKEGNQIRVTVQLISVADGFHLWSETYERAVGDVFQVQEEIARNIAARLQGGTNTMIFSARQIDPRAHKLYLDGRIMWNKRTEAGLTKAIELFRGALDLQPDYVAAHGALSSSYVLLPIFSFNARASSYKPLARAEADRALNLDPNCAEAHASLGILAGDAGDPREAERQFLRAIEIDPNFPTAHQWYGRFLELNGRRDEALAQLRIAIDLDPLSPILHSTIPEYYLLGRQYDRAIEEGRTVVQQFPEFPPARAILIGALVKRERYEEALVEIEKVRALVPGEPLFELEMKGFVLARSGREPEARKILADLQAQTPSSHMAEGAAAFVYVGLREYDKALDIWEKFAESEGLSSEKLCDPFVDELRPLPRFQAWLQRAGIVDPMKAPLPAAITNAAVWSP